MLIFVALAFGYWLTTDDDKEVVAWLVVSAVASLVAWLLLTRFVPGVEEDPDTTNRPARVGLILAIVSAVGVVGFWLGIPFAVGVPALVLAAEGRARAASQGRAGEATAAAVIAALAVLLGVVASLTG